MASIETTAHSHGYANGEAFTNAERTKHDAPPGPNVPPRPPCTCGHAYTQHVYRCSVPGCGCELYRDGVMG